MDESIVPSSVIEEVKSQDDANENAGMSKNQMKKTKRLARMEERKAERRAEEKTAKKKQKLVRKEEIDKKLELMSAEEKEAFRKERQDVLEERRGDHVNKRAKLEHAQKSGPDLVIDLDFQGLMTASELKHLCQQLSYSYSANIKAPKPCHLHLVGYKGDVKAMGDAQISGLPNWVVTQTASTYVEHFAARRDKIVYLTADSETELDELQDDSIYIIGGLVDHNRYKGICLERAEKLGVATARLPIKKYVELESRAVLTVNHVVQIMVEMYNRRDWKVVLDLVLPPRKRADFQAAKAAAAAAVAAGTAVGATNPKEEASTGTAAAAGGTDVGGTVPLGEAGTGTVAAAAETSADPAGAVLQAATEAAGPGAAPEGEAVAEGPGAHLAATTSSHCGSHDDVATTASLGRADGAPDATAAPAVAGSNAHGATL